MGDEVAEISSLWQTGLMNNHVTSERFQIEDDRVMFLFHDGADAWEAKDFFWSRIAVRRFSWSRRPIMARSSKLQGRKRRRRQRKRKRKKRKRRRRQRKVKPRRNCNRHHLACI